MNPNPLFVYGTLRREYIPFNEHARLVWRGGTDLGEARTAGRLYLIDRYAGLVPAAADGEWVYGQLVAEPLMDTLLTLLDDYEGADYKRTLLPITMLADGSEHEAWVYVYQGEFHADWRIPSGRFPLPA